MNFGLSDLASATGLSASRMTRLVDDLQSRSLVTKSGELILTTSTPMDTLRLGAARTAWR